MRLFAIPTWLIAASFIAATGLQLNADDAQQATTAKPGDLAAIIDRAIDARLNDDGVTPALQADDATFVRRVTLDIAGRIPTATEARTFIQDTDPQKRQALIDRLINSADYAVHLANEIDILLLARLRQDNEWRQYLLETVKAGAGWDDIFRDVLLPEREHPMDVRPAAYLRERVRDIDKLTNDTSSLLFGVNVGCAQCHDHPLVADWQQQHYFGMQAFFKRTYQTRGNLLAEEFSGDTKFTDIAGTEQQSGYMFLTGTQADDRPHSIDDEAWETYKEAIDQAKKDDKAEPPPLPSFSPREELVRIALQPSDANFFAKNIVNRTWARLLGRGFVHPLDQMHSENEPSHPELLEALANDLIAHGYDLKRLIWAIVSSETYARSSVVDAEIPIEPDLFATAVARPLTPRQLVASLIIASRDSELSLEDTNSDEWVDRRERMEREADHIRQRIEIPDDGFQVAAEEALLFSNNDAFDREFLRDAGDRIVGRLKEQADPNLLVESAFLATLSRSPAEDERNHLAAYLDSRADRRVAAIQQLTWSLMTSPEFRFNH